ncbi:hypothetical protein ABZ897_53745 [Nonomuraea sp. NPDC046802]|uniref:hypothetical protein n=1 Tax=Nonomuraea sp. NPDC046802 TaxID=3154919 RepID=UPI0033DA9DAE
MRPDGPGRAVRARPRAIHWDGTEPVEHLSNHSASLLSGTIDTLIEMERFDDHG